MLLYIMLADNVN